MFLATTNPWCYWWLKRWKESLRLVLRCLVFSPWWFHTVAVERRSLIKIRASTGFEPVTSAIPVIISYKLHIISHHFTPHGKIWSQWIDLAPNVWLHSSVGRATHRYRGGHGFESRWSPDFFQELFHINFTSRGTSLSKNRVNSFCPSHILNK